MCVSVSVCLFVNKCIYFNILYYILILILQNITKRIAGLGVYIYYEYIGMYAVAYLAYLVRGGKQRHRSIFRIGGGGKTS